jgi:hypothetical protein
MTDPKNDDLDTATTANEYMRICAKKRTTAFGWSVEKPHD